ncbi:MAG TPA: isoprenylcysteine carboxylmethyltransferase family protein [Alphaproteobacteria bacterium]|jgi:protein-S-isoprenylcysteine O-methyltransferase Ste14|nr:isoprenylcysteine carboxylmethyltransferase family protein [Alphaproteobacteria bacterium]
MDSLKGSILEFLESTPKRSFVLYPIVVIVFELLIHDGHLNFVIWGVPLLIWGYGQYRLMRGYRGRLGGGGPGLQAQPDHIVDTGPYAYTRNPMYLGHLIFMTGLAITFQSWLALIILLVNIPWFHKRVLGDEVKLEKRFGAEYVAYKARVKRWIPYVV